MAIRKEILDDKDIFIACVDGLKGFTEGVLTPIRRNIRLLWKSSEKTAGRGKNLGFRQQSEILPHHAF